MILIGRRYDGRQYRRDDISGMLSLVWSLGVGEPLLVCKRPDPDLGPRSASSGAYRSLEAGEFFPVFVSLGVNWVGNGK